MRKHKQFDGKSEGRLYIPGTQVFDYQVRPPRAGSAPRELILLLHGFAESGERMLGKLGAALPDDALVIAPNGTFPMAVRTPNGYTMVYAWYFYDTTKKEYIIDMRLALEHLSKGLKELGVADLPKRIIGFSQGGYLAPFVAPRLGGVRQIVGIACEYLHDELFVESPNVPGFRVDAIHGAKDEMVPLHEARDSHAALIGRGVAGTLHVLDETTHKMDAAVCDKLREVLQLQS